MRRRRTSAANTAATMPDFSQPDHAALVRLPPNSLVVGARFGMTLARQNSGKMKLCLTARLWFSGRIF